MKQRCRIVQITILLLFASSSVAFNNSFRRLRCNILRPIDCRYTSQFYESNIYSLVPQQLHTSESRPKTKLNLSNPYSSLVKTLQSYHGDSFYCMTALLLLSTFGITLEKRTTIGKALSAPLATMALSLTLANIGVLPFEAPIYTTVNAYLIPLAVPMLLFDSDLRRVLRDTGTLLIAFGVGAVATVVATIVAFPLIPMKSLGTNNWKVACALAARHIGGAINFVAVSETLGVAGTAVSAAIAADNVVVALYFAMLFAISEPGPADKITSTESVVVDTTNELEYSLTPSNTTEPRPASSKISLAELSMAASISSLLATLGRVLTKSLLPAGTSSLPVTSFLTVLAATIFPSFFANIRTAGTALGVIFIQMFFAASGATGSLRSVMQQAPSLFAFSSLQLAVHFAVLIILGRLVLKLPSRELYLASNANVGGPTTAAAMAQAKNWKALVLPALLVGILGYATATGIALALGPVLQRLPILTKY